MIDQGMRERIQAAIAKAEQGTRAEFVAALVGRADPYRGTATMAAAVLALIAGAAVGTFLPWPGPLEIILAEVIVFAVVYGLMVMTPLGPRLASPRRKHRAVVRLARLLFLDRGLASTPEQCGVLFLVAEAERQVEIIADRGIDQAVEAGAWQQIVDAFTAAVKRGAVEQGFIGAIESLGALLARHYPADGNNPNRISDRLIVL